MDKNNRSITLLRYIVVFTINNFKEILTNEQIKQIVHAGIYDYFYPKNEKKKNVRLISVYLHTNYVEINFQALPVFNLRNFIKELYIHSKKYILRKSQQSDNIIWSGNIFLGTRRQIVKQQVDAYLDIQKTLSTIDKF